MRQMTVDANVRAAPLWVFAHAGEKLRSGVALWVLLAVVGWVAAGTAAVM